MSGCSPHNDENDFRILPGLSVPFCIFPWLFSKQPVCESAAICVHRRYLRSIFEATYRH